MGFAAKAWIKGLGACALSMGLGLIDSASARAEISGYTSRYSDVGQLDPGFNGTGTYVGTAPGHDVFADTVIDSSNRALTCGHWSNGNGPRQLFAGRYKTDGTPDPAYGVFGWTQVSSAQQLVGVACTLDINGKLVVVAEEGVVGTTTPSFYLARFNTNGSLDWSFGLLGLKQISMPGAHHVFPVDVVVTSDGKINVGGDIDNVSGSNEAFVTRHLANGDLDATFGIGGRARTTFGHTDLTVKGMTVDNQNRPVLSGSGGQSLMVARLTPWGTPDSGFGPDGKRYVTIANQTMSEGRSVIIDENNKVVVLGNFIYAPSGWSVPVIVRFSSAGVIDTSFGVNGRVIRYDMSSSFVAYDLARAPDNKLLVSSVAVWTNPAGYFMSVWRFSPAGVKDTTFGNGGTGIAFTYTPGIGYYPFSLAVDSNKRVVVSGAQQTP